MMTYTKLFGTMFASICCLCFTPASGNAQEVTRRTQDTYVPAAFSVGPLSQPWGAQVFNNDVSVLWYDTSLIGNNFSIASSDFFPFSGTNCPAVKATGHGVCAQVSWESGNGEVDPSWRPFGISADFGNPATDGNPDSVYAVHEAIYQSSTSRVEVWDQTPMNITVGYNDYLLPGTDSNSGDLVGRLTITAGWWNAPQMQNLAPAGLPLNFAGFAEENPYSQTSRSGHYRFLTWYNPNNPTGGIVGSAGIVSNSNQGITLNEETWDQSGTPINSFQSSLAPTSVFGQLLLSAAQVYYTPAQLNGDWQVGGPAPYAMQGAAYSLCSDNSSRVLLYSPYTGGIQIVALMPWIPGNQYAQWQTIFRWSQIPAPYQGWLHSWIPVSIACMPDGNVDLLWEGLIAPGQFAMNLWRITPAGIPTNVAQWNLPYGEWAIGLRASSSALWSDGVAYIIATNNQSNFYAGGNQSALLYAYGPGNGSGNVAPGVLHANVPYTPY